MAHILLYLCLCLGFKQSQDNIQLGGCCGMAKGRHGVEWPLNSHASPHGKLDLNVGTSVPPHFHSPTQPCPPLLSCPEQVVQWASSMQMVTYIQNGNTNYIYPPTLFLTCV